MTGNKGTLRVGITGAIGTGKSEVCRILHGKGYPVIDADGVARELTEESSEIRRELRARFGDHIFDTKGRLQRRSVARMVFRDQQALHDLNAIIHPPMIAAIEERMAHLAESNGPFVFAEAAVIYEARMESLFEFVAVVTADIDLSVRRVAARNGLSEEEVWDRYRSQIPLEEKMRRADYVIHNDATLAELERRVERFLTWLEAKG